MTKIYVWPNDDWCNEDELEDALQWHSDDFRVIEISDDWDYDKIEEFVYQLNRGNL